MDIGWAVMKMRQGQKVCRTGWNGKGMYIVLMPDLHLPPFNSKAVGPRVNERTALHIGQDQPLNSKEYVAMLTATGAWQPGWLASQADLLGNDWSLFPPPSAAETGPDA